LWQQVTEDEQDDLYWFELGALQARCGQLDEARSALETALEQNPEFLFAIEALIPVLSASGDYSLAEQRLLQLLDQGIDPAFCYAELAQLYVQQHDFTAAADFVRQALAAGNNEPNFIMLAAAVLEHVGALDEAEAVLKMLPVAGCGGGISLPLAEFWLRQKHELGKILDTFNAACREEPDNPRWQLRVAQTYLARNWVKDGVKLLRKVVDDPRLSDEMAEEARQLLAEHS
jgi:tetratricopeptide (TPR) repeat protein